MPKRDDIIRALIERTAEYSSGKRPVLDGKSAHVVAHDHGDINSKQIIAVIAAVADLSCDDDE